MLRFEFRKYILKPSVIAFLILFLVLNVCKTFELYFYIGGGRTVVSGVTTMDYAWEKIYDKYGGEITADKISALKQEADDAQAKLDRIGLIDEPMEGFYTGYPYGDVQLFKYDFIPAYEYAILYPNHSNGITQMALENISYFSSSDSYEAAKNKLIADCYINRSVSFMVKPEGYERLFDYKFSSLLGMLIIVLAISPIFSGEYVTGTDKLIISSGKRKLSVRTKLIASLIFTVFVSALFYIQDLITTNAFYGLDYMNAPIYALQAYTDCPFNITISTAILISFFARLLFMLCFSAMVCAISTCFKNVAGSLVVSIGLGALLVILSEILPKHFDIIGLLYMSDFYSDFSVCNVFGIPVFSLVTAAVTAVLIALASVLFTVRRALR